jgi:hypothetical protein
MANSDPGSGPLRDHAGDRSAIVVSPVTRMPDNAVPCSGEGQEEVLVGKKV